MGEYHGNPERCPNCLGGPLEWLKEFKVEYCSPSYEEEFNLWIQGFIDRSTWKRKKSRP